MKNNHLASLVGQEEQEGYERHQATSRETAHWGQHGNCHECGENLVELAEAWMQTEMAEDFLPGFFAGQPSDTESFALRGNDASEAKNVFDHLALSESLSVTGDWEGQFDVIARPKSRLPGNLLPGDLLLTRSFGEGKAWQAIVVSGKLLSREQAMARGFSLDSAKPGVYLEVATVQPVRRRPGTGFAKRVGDEWERLLPNCMILRAQPRAYNSQAEKNEADDAPTQQSKMIFQYNTDLDAPYMGGNFDFLYNPGASEAIITFRTYLNYVNNYSETDKRAFISRLINAAKAWDGAAAVQIQDDRGNYPVNINLRFNVEIVQNRAHANKKTDVFPAGPGHREKVIRDFNVNIDSTFETLAHELGHVWGLEDEYDEKGISGWFQKRLPAGHVGPDSPYLKDVSALMNNGQEFRGRYFRHFGRKLLEAFSDLDKYKQPVIHGGKVVATAIIGRIVLLKKNLAGDQPYMMDIPPFNPQYVKFQIARLGNHIKKTRVPMQEAIEASEDTGCHSFNCWVQESLNLILQASMLVNGKINSEAKEKLKEFQRRTQLPVDGNLTPLTERALLEARAKVSSPANVAALQLSSTASLLASATQRIMDYTSQVPMTACMERVEDEKRKLSYNFTKRRAAKRDPRKIRALVLHHMAFLRTNQTPESHKCTNSHFIILKDGSIYQLHPVSAYLWASHGFNDKSVAVEFAGNFRNENGGGPDIPTQAQYEAGRFLVQYLVHTLGIDEVLTHRQSSSKTGDPGPDIWYHVGEWAIRNAGIRDSTQTTNGTAASTIPAAWRNWGQSTPRTPAPASSAEWNISEATEAELALKMDLASLKNLKDADRTLLTQLINGGNTVAYPVTCQIFLARHPERTHCNLEKSKERGAFYEFQGLWKDVKEAMRRFVRNVEQYEPPTEIPPATATNWQAFKTKVVEIALREESYWATTKLREWDVEGFKKVLGYWRNYTGKPDLDLLKKIHPEKHYWSAAFISYVMRMAGAGKFFPFSTAHATYIRAARQKKPDNPFWLYKIEEVGVGSRFSPEYRIEPGDIICFARDHEGNGDPASTFDIIQNENHCDIVTRIVQGTKPYLEVTGGNVRQNVATKRVPLDPSTGKVKLPTLSAQGSDTNGNPYDAFAFIKVRTHFGTPTPASPSGGINFQPADEVPSFGETLELMGMKLKATISWGTKEDIAKSIEDIIRKLHPELAGKTLEQMTKPEKATYQQTWIQVRKELFGIRKTIVSSGILPPLGGAKIPYNFVEDSYNGNLGLRPPYGNDPRKPERLDRTLESLFRRKKITLTQDELDVFQRIANVETEGLISTLNTYDAALVTIGFMQFTIHVGKIQEWIKLDESAFRRYGIELDPSATYQFPDGKVPAIKGVPDSSKDDLRWNGWAERFYYAALDEDVIIAEVKLAKIYLQKHLDGAGGLKRRLNNDALYNTFLNNYYKNDAYVRGLFQASFNNSPLKATKSVREAIEGMDKGNTSLKHFLEKYKEELKSRYFHKKKDGTYTYRLVDLTANGTNLTLGR